MGLFSTKISTAEARIAHLTTLLAVFDLAPDATAQEATARLAAIQTAAGAARDEAHAQQIAEAQAAATSAAERATAATADLAAAQVQATVLRAAIGYPAEGAISPEAVQAHLEARTAASAARIVSGAGHDAPIAVAAGDAAAGESLEELRERLRAETDPKRAGDLVERVRVLRDKAWRN